MDYATLKPFLFAVFFLTAMGGFTFSVWRLVRFLSFAKHEKGLTSNPIDRIGDVIFFVFFQKRVVDQKFGWNHVLFFWGFMIITVGHIEFLLRGVFPRFSMSFLGDALYSTILRGEDTMAFLVLFAVGAALFRRIVIKPSHINYKSKDGFAVLTMISLVMITYFAAIGAGIHGQEPHVSGHASWLPISNSLAKGIYAGLGVDQGAAGTWLYETFWWSHAFVLLFFLNYIPWSKHQHLLGAIPNIFLSIKDKPKAALTKLDFENTEQFGVGKVTDFTWKQLLDTYACTECGRCDLFCPARNTGKALHPQKVIHDMKINMYANGGDLIAKHGLFSFVKAKAPAEGEEAPAEGEEAAAEKLPLFVATEAEAKEGQISHEVLWGCTTCGACVDACPVLIGHVDAILDMRRHLTMMEGSVSNELTGMFKNVENNYNPWGIGADKRADWAEGLGLKLWESKEDAGKFEYLFWVGCAGSYDNRAQKTVKSFTKIMDEAGLSYAILGTNESCTGDPLRRTGNEYAFDAQAQTNVATLNDFGVKKIVTACPHCLNTLKNEYPAFGGNYEVLHHSQLISDLLASGKVKLQDGAMSTVAFHDPCYLGRWNDEYEAPRATLAAQKHLKVVEMERTKRTAMCCGAGGGQMWKEEEHGTGRVNALRTEQALATGADTIAVACPFCMTMLSDGVKEKGKEESVRVLDIAELVEQSMVRKS